jgi:hypothetical protein
VTIKKTSRIVCPTGRLRALALRDMGIRAVITPEGLVFAASKPIPRAAGERAGDLGAKFQPRDEMGQFVAYWVLNLEIAADLVDIEDGYGPGRCSGDLLDAV